MKIHTKDLWLAHKFYMVKNLKFYQEIINNSKIKTSFDNYVGYIKSSNYEDNFIPKYKIFKIKAKVFKKPILKKINETTKFLTFSSKISSIRETLKFVEYEKNKWIKKNDIKKIDHIKKNYLKIFKSFLWVGVKKIIEV